MKKCLIISLIATVLLAEYQGVTSYSIFYGIGEASYSGQWYFNENVNNFSGDIIADIDCNTQIWLLNQAWSIYGDEGDSILSINYAYRCYKEGGIPCDWCILHPQITKYTKIYTGAWSTSFSISNQALLSLPMCSGMNCLELSISFCIAEADGDTLEIDYESPDGKELLAFVKVSGDEEGSTALELDHFIAEYYGNDVVISWKTQSESENACFILSRNGENIASINGAGTSTDIHDYEHVDLDLSPGKYTYILSAFDYAGQETQCAKTSVCVEENQEENMYLQIYPNPFNPRVNLSVEFKIGNNTHIKIYNTHGHMVEEVLNEYLEAGRHNILWDASNMPSGVYILSMTAGNTVSTQKLVLMK